MCSFSSLSPTRLYDVLPKHAVLVVIVTFVNIMQIFLCILVKTFFSLRTLCLCRNVF